MTILNALKGINGDYEIQRILGAFGTTMYVLSAPAFVWAGKVSATLDTFCLVFPTGLGVCIGATAGAIALKDRNVATARVIEETGSQPGAAALGPVQPVQVVNGPGDPVPVDGDVK